MGFKVCAERCDQCLFSKEAIVSNARRRQVLNDCRRHDSHFVCHKHGVGSEDELHGEDVCCRGFYDRDPGATNLMRIAGRLGMVEFVPEPGCICGSAGPDADGNYDQLEDDACPRHGSADPVSEKQS